MKFIITYSICLFSTLTLYSQAKNIKSISVRDLSKFDVTFLTENVLLDKQTSILATTVNRNKMYKSALFLAEGDENGENVNYTELATSHFDQFKANGCSYIKIDDKIFRLRIEREKTETQFFLDELVNLDFVISKTAFYKGSSETLGKYCEVKPNFTQKSFLLITHDGGGQYYPEVIKTGREIHSITEFAYDGLNVLSTNKINFKPKEKCLIRDEIVLNETYYMSTIYFDIESKSWKAKLLVYNNNVLHQHPIETKQALFISSLNFFTQNGNLYLNSLHRSLDADWIISLFKIKTTTESELLSETTIDPKDLYQEYFKTDAEIKKIDLEPFSFGKMIVDPHTSDIYLFHFKFVSNFDGQAINVNAFPDELDASDLLITKISNNTIIWNKLIRRTLKAFRIYPPIPEVIFDEQSLSFTEMENSKLYDDKGNYIRGERTVLKANNLLKIRINVNKKDGSFDRKVLQ